MTKAEETRYLLRLFPTLSRDKLHHRSLVVRFIRFHMIIIYLLPLFNIFAYARKPTTPTTVAQSRL